MEIKCRDKNVPPGPCKNAPIGIGLLENSKLRWMNDDMLEMFGLSAREKYQDEKTTVFYASVEDIDHFYRNVYSKLTTQKTAEGDVAFRHKDGSRFTGHLKLSCQGSNDPREIVLISISDISWQKKKKREQIEEEKLNGLVESDGIVCHELSQSMQIVAGYMDLIARGMEEDHHSDDHLAEIQQATLRIKELTQKLNHIVQPKTMPCPNDNTIHLQNIGTSGSRLSYANH